MVQEGHSRWPVYRGDVNNIIGMLLVKSLVLINPQDNVPVRNIPLRRLPVVNENTPLYQVLNMFKQGKSSIFHVSFIQPNQFTPLNRSHGCCIGIRWDDCKRNYHIGRCC